MDVNLYSRELVDVELRSIQVFNAVVEYGGYSESESALGIGISTISIHITKLEKKYKKGYVREVDLDSY